MRAFGRFSFIFLFFALTLYAGAFDRFQTTSAEVLQKFYNKQDKSFQIYLHVPWKEYSNITKNQNFTILKNCKSFVTKPSSIVAIGPRVLLTLKPLKRIHAKVFNIYKGNMTFHFFGFNAIFKILKQNLHANFYPRTKQGIINFFDTVSYHSVKNITSRLKDISKILHLNNWGIFMLTHQLSSIIFKNDDNINLFTWYLLNKLHFDVKIALSNQQVILLAYCKNNIYNTSKFIINHKKYYIFFKKDRQIVNHLTTYFKTYPLATKALNLNLKFLPKLPKLSQKKIIKFNYLHHNYTFYTIFNKNLIDFMESYPQTDEKIYFDAPMQAKSFNKLALQLINDINGKRASRAMNFVLTFVQHAFGHQYNKGFLSQKRMFAQEALYHKNLNCQARAVLYAYLIRKIFSVNVIGLLYKDYISTALDIPMQGYSFMIGKNRYVIADPSYINANIGQIPSKYIGIKPQKFIQIDNYLARKINY